MPTKRRTKPSPKRDSKALVPYQKPSGKPTRKRQMRLPLPRQPSSLSASLSRNDKERRRASPVRTRSPVYTRSSKTHTRSPKTQSPKPAVSGDGFTCAFMWKHLKRHEAADLLSGTIGTSPSEIQAMGNAQVCELLTVQKRIILEELKVKLPALCASSKSEHRMMLTLAANIFGLSTPANSKSTRTCDQLIFMIDAELAKMPSVGWFQRLLGGVAGVIKQMYTFVMGGSNNSILLSIGKLLAFTYLAQHGITKVAALQIEQAKASTPFLTLMGQAFVSVCMNAHTWLNVTKLSSAVTSVWTALWSAPVAAVTGIWTSFIAGLSTVWAAFLGNLATAASSVLASLTWTVIGVGFAIAIPLLGGAALLYSL
ncbi:MAG TPA: hypothetical protein VM260_19370, partial [Pirellula sp.]|nr:hypothetical protein [Pirellula sp.]